MLTVISLLIGSYLIIVITQKIQSFISRKIIKKVIGKFKDETAGEPIRDFVGLKSKMYSYLKDNDQNNKTAKGVKKNIIKKVIVHQDYLDVLNESKVLNHQMKTIRSDCHQISSYQINKISLSPFDDKRYILSDGISSYAYGNLNIT